MRKRSNERMLVKKNTLFELEQKLEQAFRDRPVVYGFHMSGGRLLSVEQVTMIINNVAGYDRVHVQAIGACAVPGCEYPLHEDNVHYVYEVGNVCNACHEMIDIVRQRAFFQEMHRRWKQGKEEPPKEDAAHA